MKSNSILNSLVIWEVLIVAVITTGVHGDDASSNSSAEAIDDVVYGKFEMISDPTVPEFANFLKNMEYSDLFIAIIKTIRPIIEISKLDSGEYEFKAGTKVISMTNKFYNGIEFTDKLGDLRPCKTVYTLKGKKLYQRQKTDKVEGRLIYEFSKEGVENAMMSKNAKALMKYKRIQ